MARHIHHIHRFATVPDSMAGRRLDQVATELFGGFSRSRLQTWIREGALRIDGSAARPRHRVAGGEALELAANVEENPEHGAEPIPLDVVYEDEAIIALNKPPGLVVHPAAGNRTGTLQNALLHRDPELAALPRAGIVHRLDKDTSGLMVVARTLEAHAALVEALQLRLIRREYDALVRGELIAGGRVEAPIARHPSDRKRMAVVERGKPAATQYRVAERFHGFTRLSLQLESGRTHQIRVHMSYIKHPVVGDPVYGGRFWLPKGASEAVREAIHGFRRQALHARRLALTHPVTEAPLELEAPLPEDYARLLDVLREAQS